VQTLPDKGSALLAKYKRFQKLSLLIYALAAIIFVFWHNIPAAIVVAVLNIFLEMKLYVCPHCGKKLDCRRKVNEETCCPQCEKYLFRGL
jgi:hypothetical protein